MLIRHRRIFRDHLPPLRERERDDAADVVLRLMKGVCVVAVALLALWLIWRL